MKALLVSTILLASMGSYFAQESLPPASAKTSPEREVTLLVSGLEDKTKANQAKDILRKLDGARPGEFSPKTLSVHFDPAKTDAATIRKTLSDSGFTVSGQKAFFKIKGLVCISCANHLTQLLAKEEGVLFVNSISYLNGNADISFDPEKTTQAKIVAAVDATRYKVAQAALSQ